VWASLPTSPDVRANRKWQMLAGIPEIFPGWLDIKVLLVLMSKTRIKCVVNSPILLQHAWCKGLAEKGSILSTTIRHGHLFQFLMILLK